MLSSLSTKISFRYHFLWETCEQFSIKWAEELTGPMEMESDFIENISKLIYDMECISHVYFSFYLIKYFGLGHMPFSYWVHVKTDHVRSKRIREFEK